MRETAISTLKITSDAFKHQTEIPVKYTCEGENINPSLNIANIPEGTESLAIIVDDPDAPDGTFTHWMVWNIPLRSRIEENSPTGGTEGENDFGKFNYSGPCPPSGRHSYYFRIYALSMKISLDPHARRAELLSTMDGKILAYGELIGVYEKKQG